jgi:hypothetical protein
VITNTPAPAVVHAAPASIVPARAPIAYANIQAEEAVPQMERVTATAFRSR